MQNLVVFPTQKAARKANPLAALKSILNGQTSTKLNSFAYSPEKVKKQSTLNLLRDNLGIRKNGEMTFLPKAISCVEATSYNGMFFYLSIEKNTVSLQVVSEEETFKVASWKTYKMVQRINKKNPNASITKAKLIEMLTQGKLVVKFNAAKSYGTVIWRVSK